MRILNNKKLIIMSINIFFINDNNLTKIQFLTGGLLKPLMESVDCREVIMSFLNFQDSRNLSLVSKEMKSVVTVDSSNVFWKSFYLQYFGNSPVILSASSICMKTVVKEAIDEFKYILKNSKTSNFAGRSVTRNHSRILINKSELYVENGKELIFQKFYFSQKKFDLYNSKEENFIEVVGGFLHLRVFPKTVKDCLIDHKFSLKFYKFYKTPVIINDIQKKWK